MKFQLNDGRKVHLIGDPHLGRRFEVGVPLSRRGEREQSQLNDFINELQHDADIIVVIGDLFDHPYVGYNVVDHADRIFRKIVSQRSDTLFVVIAGNHDLPRNVETVGAFHDFCDRLEGRFENLRVLLEPEIIEGIAFFPWQWDVRSDEQVRTLSGSYEAAVGHWDLAEFNGKDDHLAPAFDVPAYSGHYHVAGDYVVRGRTVHCTGSLQPYTHGEDPTERLYITLDLADVHDRDLHNMNVRVRLKRGEELPQLDALSVIPLLDNSVDEGATPQADNTTSFNWDGILKSKLAPLHTTVRAFINERLPNHGEQH